MEEEHRYSRRRYTILELTCSDPPGGAGTDQRVSAQVEEFIQQSGHEAQRGPGVQALQDEELFVIDKVGFHAHMAVCSTQLHSGLQCSCARDSIAWPCTICWLLADIQFCHL